MNSYIIVPTVDDDYGEEAAYYLKDLVWGRKMMANIEYKLDSELFITVGDPSSQVTQLTASCCLTIFRYM